MKNNHIKKNDDVIVISGNDKGKKGKVLRVDHENGRVIVEGVAMATKHKKPRSMGEVGGIINQETPIYASKVMNVCAKCGAPTRVGRRVLEDGTHVRFCKKCGETFGE